MIFVDVNVPMYLVGDPHPNQARTLSALLRLARDREIFVTDVEVYQEILHRYQSTRRLHIIDAAIDCLNVIVTDVLGRVDILPEPDESAREAEEGQVPGVQFLKAGEDPAKLLHLVDETLHQVPFPV